MPTLRDELEKAVDAAVIGAGAATDAALTDLKLKFQRGTAALSRAGGNHAEAERMRQVAAQTEQQRGEDAATYQPMREAHPYATAIGEALPALAIPGGLAAFRAQAAINAGREYLSDLARAKQSARLAALADALRKY